MNNSMVEAAFRKAIDALDEAWQLVRELQNLDVAVSRVDTLSTSLANPFNHPVELMLRNAKSLVKTSDERAALLCLVGAAHVQRLITEAVAERLVREIEKA